MEQQYDVTIIGAGVTGCAIARELARFDLRVCVLEREEDVCVGTSKANSGIVHSGIDAQHGSMKARMNVEGNRLMEPLSKELDFAFRRNGSLILCLEEGELDTLKELVENGRRNGVPDIRLLSARELHEMEPNLSENVVAGAYAPTGGIVCPFGLTIALAENAAENGVEFRFLTEVKNICKRNSFKEAGYELETSQGKVITQYVVNTAGVYADEFHNRVSSQKRTVIPRRGEYCLFDKSEGNLVDKTIFQMPTKLGKGVLVTPTVHGNLLVGPNACDISDKEGTCTSAEGIADVIKKASLSVNAKGLPVRKVITSFAGLRAHAPEDDFILEEVEDAPGFFDAIGMESPGLTAAPAVGIYMAGLVVERMNRDIREGRLKAGNASRENLSEVHRKKDFSPRRKGILNPAELSAEERNQLIKEQPAYGTIVCRCERISEGEILDAIHRPLGAKSLDGVKRRTRAGMGRCQAGFCSPKTLEILARELGKNPMEITKSGAGSEILYEKM